MFYAKKIHHWLWRWHIIAGLISLPFILLLSVTGVIYLLKADYEQQTYRSITQVTPSVSYLTYQQQLDIAQKAAKENGVAIPTKMILPIKPRNLSQDAFRQKAIPLWILIREM
ncbi:PepSY-associated TM helix domain-containing protein [Photobacterium leiognathi]|uniref:PepSY-associated TM helix domain-containing protein n=1 Tax=Photobacterium leiognathi TaxID=553611 RepID=UPI002738460E|nr:PepSY-associated TM helix domain-containing protein [Photobacterium leiognathi]